MLFEEGTDSKGKELVVGPNVLKYIMISNHVITGDALFAQRNLCAYITKEHAGYVFRVKANQETLEKDIRLFFTDPLFHASIQTHTTIDRWKGCKEILEVKVSADIVSYLNWSGLTHVWWMKKTVIKKEKITITESVGIVRLPKEILGNKRLRKKYRHIFEAIGVLRQGCINSGMLYSEKIKAWSEKGMRRKLWQY